MRRGELLSLRWANVDFARGLIYVRNSQREQTKSGHSRSIPMNRIARRELLGLHRETGHWEEEIQFFDVRRTRAWVMTRRLTHTSHHRGQLMAMLRMLGHELHSNYGPTADTGGLMQDHAPTIYTYSSLDALLKGEAEGGAKAVLPRATGKPVTERPE